jgi:GNAT superfamily N-acetyltransferase
VTRKYTCEKLTDHHPLEAFTCGESTIDDWCAKGGRRAHNAWLCTVWVLVDASGQMAGFFTLTSHVVEGVNLPAKDSGGVPSSPASLIGKLALRKELRGQGLGTILIRHALDKCVEAARLSASRLITLDAANEALVAWYKKHGFKSYSADTPLKMYMKMSSAAAVVDALATEPLADLAP